MIDNYLRALLLVLLVNFNIICAENEAGALSERLQVLVNSVSTDAPVEKIQELFSFTAQVADRHTADDLSFQDLLMVFDSTDNPLGGMVVWNMLLLRAGDDSQTAAVYERALVLGEKAISADVKFYDIRESQMGEYLRRYLGFLALTVGDKAEDRSVLSSLAQKTLEGKSWPTAWESDVGIEFRSYVASRWVPDADDDLSHKKAQNLSVVRYWEQRSRIPVPSLVAKYNDDMANYAMRMLQGYPAWLMSNGEFARAYTSIEKKDRYMLFMEMSLWPIDSIREANSSVDFSAEVMAIGERLLEEHVYSVDGVRFSSCLFPRVMAGVIDERDRAIAVLKRALAREGQSFEALFSLAELDPENDIVHKRIEEFRGDKTKWLEHWALSRAIGKKAEFPDKELWRQWIELGSPFDWYRYSIDLESKVSVDKHALAYECASAGFGNGKAEARLHQLITFINKYSD